MSLLEKLKSMVSEMSEEERQEFLEDVNSEKDPEPEFVEPEELPDEIVCAEEELQEILSLRSQMIQTKSSYTDLCIKFKEQERQLLQNISLIEDMMISQADKMKENWIDQVDLRSEYTLLVQTDPVPTAKLVRK